MPRRIADSNPEVNALADALRERLVAAMKDSGVSGAQIERSGGPTRITISRWRNNPKNLRALAAFIFALDRCNVETRFAKVKRGLSTPNAN